MEMPFKKRLALHMGASRSGARLPIVGLEARRCLSEMHLVIVCSELNQPCIPSGMSDVGMSDDVSMSNVGCAARHYVPAESGFEVLPLPNTGTALLNGKAQTSRILCNRQA